jgi:CII-binding regulator of phage lambda lysogenization HflD
MAKFEPGHKLAKGRPKGAVNRSTEMMKLTIARAVDNTLNTLSSDLEKIKKKDPERAIELALKLMEFTLPKLSRTEMKAEVEQRIQQIQVNINQTGSNELGDK